MMTSSNGNIFLITGPLCGEIHWSPVNSPHKGQWRGALMFSLICVETNGWANHRDTGDLRCHRAHYDVTSMWCLEMDTLPTFLAFWGRNPLMTGWFPSQRTSNDDTISMSIHYHKFTFLTRVLTDFTRYFHVYKIRPANTLHSIRHWTSFLWVVVHDKKLSIHICKTQISIENSR